MIRKTMIVCLLLLVIMTGCYAQTLPSVNAISPGISKWLATAADSGAIKYTVNGNIDQLFHIRDLSVLKSIISGVRVESTTGYVQDAEVTHLRLLCENEIIADVTYGLESSEIRFSMDGKDYAVAYADILPVSGDTSVENTIASILSVFTNHSPIERLDMKKLSDALRTGSLFEQLSAFDPGLIQVNETYSDDGLRLTRLEMNGSFYYQNEPWTMSGKIFKPGGDSPKDTAEIVFSKDERNYLKLTLSSKYSTEKGRKDQYGVITGNCRINIAGKLDGYDVTYVIGLKIRDEWNADGVNLFEKVTVTPSLNWTDKTPGRKYLHLNHGSLTVKNDIQLYSTETSEQVSEGTCTAAIELKMDGEEVAVGSFGIYFARSDEKLVMPDEGEMLSKESFLQMWDSFVQRLSKKIYDHMGEKTRKSVMQGM